MTTDRELLERAAKAAGIQLVWRDKYDAGYFDEWIVDHPNPHWVLDEWPHEKWNPLQDDGDAFRLAVKLRIDLYNYAPPIHDVAHVDAVHMDGKQHGSATEELGDDAAAATRRAIVRAAAAMATLA